MGKLNRAWHETHRMPANPTSLQRAQWHYEHALNCGCRVLTPSIQAQLARHGLRLPADAPGLAS